MYVYELSNYFNRVPGTIKNGIIKMNKVTNGFINIMKTEKLKFLKKVLNGYIEIVLNTNI